MCGRSGTRDSEGKWNYINLHSYPMLHDRNHQHSTHKKMKLWHLLLWGFLFQGAVADAHGCSIHALDPILGEFTQAGGGVGLCVYQCLLVLCSLWVPSGVLLLDNCKLVAYCVGFIKTSPLEHAVMSQCNAIVGNTIAGQMSHKTTVNCTKQQKNHKNCKGCIKPGDTIKHSLQWQ